MAYRTEGSAVIGIPDPPAPPVIAPCSTHLIVHLGDGRTRCGRCHELLG